MRKPLFGTTEGKPEPTEPRAASYFLEPGTLIDQYIIERPLAGGGFSSVYLARQSEDQTQVAIKEYLPRRLAHRNGQLEVVPVTEDARRAFIRGRQLFLEEAKVLTRLKHRNIVEVLNFFRANATVYLVMTFEYGKVLGDYLLKEKKGGVSEQFLTMVFLPLLDGVRTIHNNGLLHLDIKPHNILIRSGGDPLLLDFGACQPYPYEERSRIGKVLSNGFSPIEQYDQDGMLGPWSDLYALGATMRMCLDGTFPPSAPERAERDILVPAAKAYRRRYSPIWLEAIDWAMEIHPEQRPQSVAEFLMSLTPAPPGQEPPTE
ncbi:Serine/threonine protein kinase [Methylomagnum ishizawai]|uniref:Serine/threonine protein kinase n=1 Tax=Methylomagnum ishizawai TaxID=1760988 RepID=A0A1Y6CTP9_9GAMM|nr:serine/threonine-protein kinase [Methylomagnum ishizawai]SMF93998.1 Serine/threonine protein kinase [Methylomagnum ishizawai]